MRDGGRECRAYRCGRRPGAGDSWPAAHWSWGQDFSPGVIAATTAVAAGAILAMVVDTMIPEAFAIAHDFAGLITVAGFLAAFALSMPGS